MQLNPSFALAWASLPAAEIFIYAEFDRTPQRLAKGKEALDAALRLAPEAGETQFALGLYRYRGLTDYDGALAAFSKARGDASSRVEALEFFAYVKRRQGKWDEALALHAESQELDPRNTILLSEAALTHRALLRFDESLRLLDRALEIEPNSFGLLIQKAEIRQAQGNLETATRLLASVPVDGQDPKFLDASLNQWRFLRQYAQAIDVLRRLLTAPENLPPTFVSHYRAYLGFMEALAGQTAAARTDLLRAQEEMVALRGQGDERDDIAIGHCHRECEASACDQWLGRPHARPPPFGTLLGPFALRSTFSETCESAKPPIFFAELKRRNVYKVAIAYAVIAWLLIQIATQVFPFIDIPNWAARLVVLLLVIGFPIALVLAGAFELTPEGIKRTEEVTLPHRAGRGWIGVVLIGALAAGGLLWFQLSARKQPAPQTITTDAKSVAVLPFENLSEKKENAYFVDGIQDEVITRLAKIGELLVISRTSTQRYKTRPSNLAEIAHELGVSHLVEGTVQRVGDRVRINLQLIRAANESHLWAEIYDRDLTDIFAVQSELATRIAESLQATLSGAERKAVAEKPTSNLAAYDAYLRGIDLYSRPGQIEANVRKVADAFAEAVRLDPQFAQAWASLSIVHASLSTDPVYGPIFEEYLAAVETQVGEIGRAIPRIERLLTIPYGAFPLSQAKLRLDPIWDPLRSHRASKHSWKVRNRRRFTISHREVAELLSRN